MTFPEESPALGHPWEHPHSPFNKAISQHSHFGLGDNHLEWHSNFQTYWYVSLGANSGDRMRPFWGLLRALRASPWCTVSCLLHQPCQGFPCLWCKALSCPGSTAPLDLFLTPPALMEMWADSGAPGISSQGRTGAGGAARGGAG